MKKHTLFLIIFISYSCYSMENINKEIIVQRITDPNEFKKGCDLADVMYDKIFAKDSILTSEEKDWINEYRRTKAQDLLKMPNREDAFCIKNNEIISFIASHRDEKKPTRVILDSVYLGSEKPNLETVPIILGYLRTKYPDAMEFWAAILKKNEPSVKLLESQGFIRSKYIDTLHNQTIFQGWKLKINKIKKN